MTISKCHRSNEQMFRSISLLITLSGDAVAFVQRSLTNAVSLKRCWRSSFQLPVLRFASRVLDAQVDLYVRFCPFNLRNGPSYRHWLVWIVVVSSQCNAD